MPGELPGVGDHVGDRAGLWGSRSARRRPLPGHSSIGRSLSEEELSELPECVLRERGVNYEYM